MKNIAHIYTNIRGKRVRDCFGKLLTLSIEDRDTLLNVYEKFERINDNPDSNESIACGYLYRLIRLNEMPEFKELWASDAYEFRMELAKLFMGVMNLATCIKVIFTYKEYGNPNSEWDPNRYPSVAYLQNLRMRFKFIEEMTPLDEVEITK